jgi:hypothetical protein
VAVRRAALLLFLLVPGVAAAQPEEEEVSVQAKQVSCTSGPYRIKFPKSYKALKRMAVLKREKVLSEEEAAGGERTTARELRFVGLEMVVYTSSERPDHYQLARATFTTSKWRIMGPLRVGAPIALAVKGLPVKPMPRFGEVTLEGENDSILLSVAGGRVQEIDYECSID